MGSNPIRDKKKYNKICGFEQTTLLLSYISVNLTVKWVLIQSILKSQKPGLASQGDLK